MTFGIFDFEKCFVMLRFKVASLCNQLLEFSSKQYENMQRCYKHHIEDYACDILEKKK